MSIEGVKLHIFMYYKIIIVALIVLFGVASMFFLSSEKVEINEDDYQDIKVVMNNDGENEEELVEEVHYYFVDIKGAVTNPSVYKLERDSRVFDVIKMAGGLTREADTSVLNLSKKIMDEMTIIIYSKNEIKRFKEAKESATISEIIKYVNVYDNCPDPLVNQACIDNSENTETPEVNKVSLNNASVSDLQTLPGIGESKALEIIKYRDSNGPFKSIDDIKKVSGIGDGTFDKIKDHITL